MEPSLAQILAQGNSATPSINALTLATGLAVFLVAALTAYHGYGHFKRGQSAAAVREDEPDMETKQARILALENELYDLNKSNALLMRKNDKLKAEKEGLVLAASHPLVKTKTQAKKKIASGSKTAAPRARQKIK